MNWVEKSTLDNFMEEQRRRIVVKLWLHETPKDNRETDEIAGFTELGGYTRRELMHDGNIERRS